MQTGLWLAYITDKKAIQNESLFCLIKRREKIILNGFFISANFEDSGKIMGFFSTRNVVEAVILALPFAFIIDIATLFNDAGIIGAALSTRK